MRSSVDECLRLPGRVFQDLAHVGGQAVEAAQAHRYERRRVDVSGKREVRLHFLKFLGVDLRQRVFFPVHHSGGECGKDFGKLHRARVRAVGLKHLEPPLAFRHPQLDALQIGRLDDRALAIGDVAISVFPYRKYLEPFRFRRGLELRPENLAFDFRHVRAILDQVWHFEQAEKVGFGRHDRRGQGKIQGSQLELLQHLFVAAKLAGAEHHDARLVA